MEGEDASSPRSAAMGEGGSLGSRPSTSSVVRRLAAVGLALASIVAAGVFTLDRLDKAFPPPLGSEANLSVETVDRDGRTLRVFANGEDRWRLKADLDKVDPEFVAMLIAYEDKRFYSHHGVDPLAMLRAAGQLVTHGRIVSG